MAQVKYQLVNIPRSVKDEFHRYKMPVLQAKVEGRGNGIKTVIVNMSDIAKSLDRPPAYPTKFFGFELGALTKCDAETDRYIVNGKHDTSKLADLLDTFIEKFILCSCCNGNPETQMLIKNGAIELKCKACGGRTPVDMRHKLSTYITKNPPSKEDKTPATTAGAPKKGSSKTSSSKTAKSASNGNCSSKATKAKSDEEGEEDSSGEEWAVDTSKEAVEKRRIDLLGEATAAAVQLLNIDTPAEDSSSTLHQFVTTGNPSNAEIIAKAKSVLEQKKLSNQEITKVLFASLFNKDMRSQITPRADVFKPFCGDPKARSELLTQLEALCTKETSLQKTLPSLLQGLYDAELVNEDEIFRWHTNPGKGADSAIRKEAQVFVTWLKTAEEESDED